MTMTNNTNTNNNMNNSNSSKSTTRHESSVPDLLSFDSWDYDGDSNNMVSATSSFTTDTSLAPSCDENDSHQHSSSASAKNSFTAPVFATDDIYIQVSGVSFILNPNVFRQLEKLPWSLVNNTNNDGNNVMYSLGTSPDLFEIILNYVLFESLPNLKLLSQSEIEELEPMVLITGLQGLQNHLEKKALKTKFLRGRSLRRNTSTAAPAQQLHQQLERHMSTNSMNKNGSSKDGDGDGDGDDNDNKKTLRRQVSAPVLGAFSTHENNNSNNNLKGMASRLVEAVSRRLPNQQQQQQAGRKLTHAQCVASGLVD
jgi:hypothetical protein